MSHPDSEHSMDEGEALRRRAADWILMQDRGFTPDEQDAFSQWLAEHPRHREAYKQRLQFWNRIGQLRRSSEPPVENERVGPRMVPKPKVGRNAFALVALAACLCLGVYVWYALLNTGAGQTTSEALLWVAEDYQRHTLEDGSVVELNVGARISVQYSERNRTIFLKSGEAHFTVAKDATRPFLVHAGDSVVRAVGTAFNVCLDSDSVEVLVTEGLVRLTTARNEDIDTRPEEPESFFIELEQGQRSLVPVERAGFKPEREFITTIEIEERLEWKSPLIQFTTQPLKRVIAEFNRYNDIQIELGDPALGDRAITAALRMNNLEGFIELVEVGMGIRAERAGDFRIVLRTRDIP